MIRKWDTEDTAPLLALWLDSTIHAHPFISESYWRDSVAVVQGCLSSRRQHRVWEQDGELKALSACWTPFRRRAVCRAGRHPPGIGRALLDEVKQHYAG